jgi:hypothetical protein
MDHGWAGGGRRLVGFYTDRNANLGLLEAMLALAGKSGAPVPTWDDIFDYVLKDGAASARSFVVVDPAKTGVRRDNTHRQALDRTSETMTSTEVLKLPRQGAFDNIHIAPQMEVGLSIPLLGGIPTTPVSMAPLCAHDCFHIHWRWSQHFTSEQNLGWGLAGPYTPPGAPMTHPNQTVTIGIAAGTPGFRYHASAAAHPPTNGWWRCRMAPPMQCRSAFRPSSCSTKCSPRACRLSRVRRLQRRRVREIAPSHGSISSCNSGRRCSRRRACGHLT